MLPPKPKITANVNVDVKGRPMALPTESQIANDAFGPVCVILEVIAARIHYEMGGDTASTTTLGLITEISCLFLTSQTNKKFDGITVELIHDWIDELRLVDYDGFLKQLQLSHVMTLEAADVKGLRAKKTKSTADKKMIETINFVYYNLYPSFIRLQKIAREWGDVFEYVKHYIGGLFVITNQQLAPSGTQFTGVHGESRFVRFCYIRYVRDLSLLNEFHMQKGQKVKIPSPEHVFGRTFQPQWDQENVLEIDNLYYECMKKLIDETEIRTMKIFCASSQGTCNDCQKMLTKLAIAHNTHRYSKESDSSNWIDPFSWQDMKSQSKPVERLNAMRIAERDTESEAKRIRKNPPGDNL